MKAKIFIILGGLLFLQSSFCQVKMPDIVPPSPKSENFLRFGNTPVSPSTGTPDISIPLYVIKSGKIEIPIVLKYHIGNIKPGEDCSDVGFGWVLDFGGQISRTIHGAPDEVVPTSIEKYKSNELDENNDNHLLFMENCLGNGTDTQYDIFNYSFLNQSGNFILKKGTDGTFTPNLLTYSPVKFSVATSYDALPITKQLITTIRATDPNGNKFVFGDGEFETCLDNTVQKYGITTWLIKEISDPSGKDRITFSYQKDRTNSLINNNYSFASIEGECLGPFYIRASGSDFYPNDIYIKCNQPLSGPKYDNKTIKEITFNGGKIIFDINSISKRIECVRIIDATGTLTKKIVLHQTSFGGIGNHMRLDNVEICDVLQSKPSMVYDFKYQNPIASSYYGVDLWGNYNNTEAGCLNRTYTYTEHWDNVSYNTRNVTKNFGTNTGDPSFEGTKSEVLYKIIYPTKGITEFIYELNSYSKVSDLGTITDVPETQAGGLRVKSIIDSDCMGKTTTKNYLYEQGLIEYPYNSPTAYTTTTFNVVQNSNEYNFYLFMNRNFQSSANGELGANTVVYGKVTELFGNSEGKIIYYYLNGVNRTYAHFNPLPFCSELPAYAFTPRKIPYSINFVDRSLLSKKETYRKNTTGEFKIQMIEKNFYDINFPDRYDNLSVFRFVSFENKSLYEARTVKRYMQNGAGGVYNFTNINMDDWRLCGSYDYYLWSNRTDLLKRDVITYSSNSSDSIVNSTSYFYENPFHNFVTKDSCKLSNNKTKISRYYYPQDYSTDIFKLFVDKNIIGKLISQNSYVNGKLVSGDLTKYDDFGNPIEVYVAETELGTSFQISKSNPYNWGVLKAQVEYKNNKLSQWNNTGNNVKIVYIWSYNRQYPIAEIKNATYDEVKAALNYTDAQMEALAASDNPDIAYIRNQFKTNFAGKPVLYTTYTYQSLVGIVSAMDSRGITTNYNYGAFNRLQNIRDLNGKILQKFDYNYKQQ